MNDPISLAWSVVAGVTLGAVFFGGLWWTVRAASESRHPAAWFLGSSLLRNAVALTGFYAVGVHQWQRLVACLLGFIGVRLLLTRLAPSPVSTPPREASHAP